MTRVPLASVQLTAALAAAAMLQAGESVRRRVIDPATGAVSGAGSAVTAAFLDALARVQALPESAWAAAVDLQEALGRLFPDSDAAPDHPAPPALVPPTAEPCPVAAGMSGGERSRARPRSRTEWLAQIDAAGLARFLRSRHPDKTAAHVSAETGVPIDTVAKILAREALPNGPNLVLMICAYGPELLLAILPNAKIEWLDGARALAEQARLDAELARIEGARAANRRLWPFRAFAAEAS